MNKAQNFIIMGFQSFSPSIYLAVEVKERNIQAPFWTRPAWGGRAGLNWKDRIKVTMIVSCISPCSMADRTLESFTLASFPWFACFCLSMFHWCPVASNAGGFGRHPGFLAPVIGILPDSHMISEYHLMTPILKPKSDRISDLFYIIDTSKWEIGFKFHFWVEVE